MEQTGNATYLKLVRFWLASILVFLPFQLKIAAYISPWSSKSALITTYLDELTVLVFLLLAVGECYRNRKVPDKFFFYLHL